MFNPIYLPNGTKLMLYITYFELKNLHKEQDKILTTLAKSKIFTKKVWSSIVGSIKDLSKRINRKIKKIEKNKKKVKKKQMEINRKDLKFI